MLGLKFIEKTQFDLWCGPSEDFTVDLLIPYESLKKFSQADVPSQEDKHLGLSITDEFSKNSSKEIIEAIFREVKKFAGTARRVTIICPDKEVYSQFRESWNFL